MKKVIIGALSLMSLVACSKNEVVEVNRNNDVIEFSVVANSLTRAETVHSNTNMPESFTVWATFDGKTFIDGDVIEKQGGSWVNTTATRYWPDGCGDTKRVTFYAYANDKGTFAGINNDEGSFSDYIVDAVHIQKDLLYAITTGYEGTVNVEFKHALSQIVFNAKCTNENLRVVIDGITVKNAARMNSASFKMVSGKGAQMTWEDEYSTLGHYSISFDPVIIDSDDNEEAVTLTSPNSTNALLLLPHNGTTPWDPNTEIPAITKGTYITIKCAIANIADGEEIMLWGTKNEEENTYITKEIAIPVSYLWTSNSQYNYTFVFGEGFGGYNSFSGEQILAPIEWGDITVNDFVPEQNLNL